MAPPHSAPTWPWALVVAALLLVGYALWAGAGDEPSPEAPDPASSVGPFENAPPVRGPGRAAPAGPAAEAAPETASGRPPTEPAPDPADAALRDWETEVLVVDATSSAPVAGANVWVASGARVAEAGGWVLSGAVLAQAVCDDQGRARLQHRGSAAPVLILGRAAGWRSASAAFSQPPTGAPVTLRLPQGLRIAGTCVGPGGVGLPGIRLCGAACLLPVGLDVAGEAGPPNPGRDLATAVTDADGRFELRGLSPGPVRVEVVSDGWCQAGPALSTTTRPGAALQPLTVEAGTLDLRIELAALRVFRLQLEEDPGGEPVPASVVSLDVLAAPGVLPLTIASYAGSPPRLRLEPERVAEPLGAWSLVPGRLDGWSLGDGSATQARVRVSAPGYEPAELDVPLLRPAELTAQRPGPSVRLKAQSAGPCAVVVDTSRSTGRLGRPERRILTACRASDGRSVSVLGARVGGDRWRFHGLPDGDVEVSVYDGLSHSLRQTVTLVAGREPALDVEFLPPTGAVVELLAADGTRLYDADQVLWVAPGAERAAADRSEATRLLLTPEGLRERLLPLAPGTYRWHVAKRGAGEATGTAAVTQGEVVHVRARLVPARAPEPASAGGARPGR